MSSLMFRLLSRPLRLPAFLGPAPRPDDPQIFRFNGERGPIIADVVRRVVQHYAGQPQKLLYVLNEAANAEVRRLASQDDMEASDALGAWRRLVKRLGKMSEEERVQELRRICGDMTEDIAGNFDPRVYALATKIVPGVLTGIMRPVALPQVMLGGFRQLDELVTVEGPIEKLRRLARVGTLVLTPTHSSNLDSVALGFALMRENLPPVVYGAGKNLFSNPLISFFMHNLGAYRVDRRLRFELYKEILKEYSTVLLESGYHSLFFPGGTRCRSNVIEPSLKLGLLGTAVTAYGNAVATGGAHKPIYVVPATINYRLVLEAETLIEDYLAETGKSRYIITDDEFSRIGRIVEFLRKILAHEGAVVIRFGRPLDPLGHDVDDDGRSLDRQGRPIDLRGFFTGADGSHRVDEQRDAEYTRLLGRRLVAAFPRESVFHATTVVARAVFDELCAQVGTRDIYQLTRLPPGREVAVPDVVRRLGALRAALAARPEAGRLHHRVVAAGDSATLDDGLRALGGYHSHPVLTRAGDHLRIGDVKLLYYYQNRLAHLPVEKS